MSEPSAPPAILEILRSIISDYVGIPAEEIHPDSTLLEDLSADSIDRAEIALAIEEEWNLEIPEEQLEQLLSVQDFVTLIANAVA